MSNQHILEFLNYYCSDEILNPQYAVLLKGKWGSGKTHFINSYKKQLDEKKKKHIYVSLYGVTSFEEIETKFLEASNPEIFNQKTIYIATLSKALINSKIKDSLNKVKQSLSFLNSKDRILIFDDIERCSINIVDLLGYINYFVEHHSYKAILIANEKELEENNKYNQIKEKLIGKTFEFISDVSLVYKSFIENQNSKNIFEKYEEDIVSIFINSHTNNLRILRQSILDFDRLYNCVLKDHSNKDELIKELVIVFFILVFEYKTKSSNLFKRLNTDVKDSIVRGMLKHESSESIKKSIYEEIEEKYKIFSQIDLLLSVNNWQNIIQDSYINKNKINDELYESKYYENQPSWRRLWSYRYLNDDNFDEVFNNVISNLKNCQYKELFLVMLISSTILELKKNDLINLKEDEIIMIIKKQIDYLFTNNLILENHIIFKEKTINCYVYNSLGFNTDLDGLEAYKKIKSYISYKIIEEEKKYYTKAYSKIVNSIRNEPSDLFILLDKDSKNIISYEDKPIFNYINVDSISKLLINATSEAQYIFGGILEDRYEHKIYTEKLESEFDFIYDLKNIIEKEIERKKGKISGYRLKVNLLNGINKALENIEKYKKIT